MDLYFIRHGEPAEDGGLTEQGRREVQALAQRLEKVPVSAYFVSPMLRAKETAGPILEKAGKTSVECSWLHEFEHGVLRPDLNGRRSFVTWDWLPQDWLSDPRLLSTEHWKENEIFQSSGIGEAYDAVIEAFDSLLAEHGYERSGLFYRAKHANEDTLAFICHFGVSCVLMSHLLNCSPMILWQGLALPPSSVSIFHSEERRKGAAIFRAASIGDISHLYASGQEPSFAARFCTVYGNGQRSD